MPEWVKSAQVLSWLGLTSTALFLVYTEIERPELPSDVRCYVDIVYKRVGWRSQKLDVYVPTKLANRPRPAIVAIHGGSWRGGTKNSFGREVALLVKRGYIVISVDYLLATPGKPSWPENLADVKEAVRWVRKHADEYGIGRTRLAAYGSSAGGHLAALLGSRAHGTDPDTEVHAVVNMYGPSDLIDLLQSPRAADTLKLLFGKTAAEAPELYAAASPLAQVSRNDPPMLLIHGEDDDSVPLAQSQRLAEQLTAQGVPAQLLVIKGKGHSFKLDAKGLNLVPHIATFLDRTLAVETAQRTSEVLVK